MENMFLMIENPGVAPEQAFTVLGASTKRGTSNSSIIGKFGTGNKQAIGVCLRNGFSPIVYAGLLRMEFQTRKEKINDGIKTTEFNRVMVKFAGKDETGANRSSCEDLGYVLEHGSTDWVDIDLALREFISNSLDRAIEQGLHNHLQQFMMKMEQQNPGFINNSRDHGSNEYDMVQEEIKNYHKIQSKDYKDVIIKVVDESKVRAKAGYTRVFMSLTTEVYNFFTNLDKWFLHFKNPELLDQVMIPSANRGIQGNNVVIYRRGVRVREILTSSRSKIPLFDYNLENLQLDEARKADELNCAYYASSALKKASVKNLRLVFEAMINGVSIWETSFTSNWLPDSDKEKKNWADAWDQVAGAKCLISTPEGCEMAKRKGYNVISVSGDFYNLCVEMGLPTPSKVLSSDELSGREIIEATQPAIYAVDYVWDKLVSNKMTNGKDKPKVKMFTKIMSGCSQTLGYQSGDTIYLNRDIVPVSGNSFNPQLMATILEELSHYITGATDNSRDFQDYILNLAIHLMMK